MQMTNEAAAAYLVRYVDNEHYTPQCQEARRMAIEALREQENPESLTNADRIRAMSDEELEKFINHFDICDLRTHEECKISYCACCKVCVMDWLRQPSEPVDSSYEDDRDSGLAEED